MKRKVKYLLNFILSLLFVKGEEKMLENKYQKKVIDRLKNQFPGCVVLKNDPGYIQGMPDLSVFYNDRWAMLEVKKSEAAHHQPNQEYYISKLNEMSYASFIFPENEEEVFDELQRSFEA